MTTKLRPWYNLTITTTNAFKKDWSLPTPLDKHYGVWTMPANLLLDPDYQQYLNDITQLEIKNIMLFLKGQNLLVEHAHVDIGTIDPKNPQLKVCKSALNFVIGDHDSEMIWYEQPPGIMLIDFTEAGTPYAKWELSTLTEVSRVRIPKDTLMLVRTDLPHTVRTYHGFRWCVSIRYRGEDKLSWEEVVTHFQNLGLIASDEQV